MPLPTGQVEAGLAERRGGQLPTRTVPAQTFYNVGAGGSVEGRYPLFVGDISGGVDIFGKGSFEHAHEMRGGEHLVEPDEQMIVAVIILGGLPHVQPRLQSGEEFLRFATLSRVIPRLLGVHRCGVDEIADAVAGGDTTRPGAR